MSHHEVQSDPYEGVLLTRKADPLLTIGFAVNSGFGTSLLYKVATSAAPVNHINLMIAGIALIVIAGVCLWGGGWRTVLPFNKMRRR